jgi:large subunit ribosomal protein L25
MKSVSMSGSPRENVGKKDARSLRRQELIPCVIYGGKEQVNLTVPLASFKDIIYTPEACLIKLSVGSKTYDVVLQDAQFHPVNDKIIHADFLQIFPDKPVKIDIPVNLTGNSPGVIKGGKLILKLRKIRVQGLMDALPDKIDVNISKLDIGDSVKVGQLVQEGLTFLNAPSSVVVMVKTARVIVLDTDTDEEEGEETEGGTPAAEQATEEPKAE